MRNVLIATKPDDSHAIFMKLALEKKGHQCTLWYQSDLPQQQIHSFSLSNNRRLSWKASGTNFLANDVNEFDVVWIRRPKIPILPDTIHPDDLRNAENENREFCRTIWQVIAPNAFWINPLGAQRSVNCKLRQLEIASAIGFNIPETLISNDPVMIKDFINRNQKQDIIYKTLCPTVWIEPDAMRLTYTRKITESDLPENSMLQNSPGIFQKRIEKAYELRVTCFGDYAVAAKLKSQEHPKGIMDWRYVPGHELIIEEYSLPEEIHEKCKILMRELGVVFGCFDFVVTPDNEYYFLEINEQGQFLWVEEINPKIKMLDVFVDFVTASSRQFAWKETSSSLAISNFTQAMEMLKQDLVSVHKNPGIF